MGGVQCTQCIVRIVSLSFLTMSDVQCTESTIVFITYSMAGVQCTQRPVIIVFITYSMAGVQCTESTVLIVSYSLFYGRCTVYAEASYNSFP